MQVLEFLPAYNSWDDWNGQLVHYFGEQQFSVLPEAEWVEVALAVTVNPVFDKYSIPDPRGFTSWQEWASALTFSINGNGA